MQLTSVQRGWHKARHSFCSSSCIPKTAHDKLLFDARSPAGRQRLQVNLGVLRHDQLLSHAQQTITADAPTSHVPPEAMQGVAFWPAHIWSRYNAYQLAEQAMSCFRDLAPQVWPCDYTVLFCPALPWTALPCCMPSAVTCCFMLQILCAFPL